MTTKRQIIDRAYSAAGLASYAFDLSPEEREQARAMLDAMVAGWGIRGARLGYNSENSLDAIVNVPDWAEEALTLNLALRLAGAIGKAVMTETKQAAREAYNAVLTATTTPIPTLARSVPMGQGNRIYGVQGETFIPQQAAPLLAGDDSELDI